MSKHFFWLTRLLAGLLMSGSIAADEIQTGGFTQYELPRFPPELVGVKSGDGDVVLVVTVDSTGTVNDSVVLEATNEAFAKSASQAVSRWQFSPSGSVSSISGTAISGAAEHASSPRREVLQFNFKRSGVVTSLSHGEAARESFFTPNIRKLQSVPLSMLDADPQRISGGLPSLSSAHLAKLGIQSVQINFVIDRDGSVHVPVVNVEDPEVAKIILLAVRSWRYTPPLYQQKPVAVEMTKTLALSKK